MVFTELLSTLWTQFVVLARPMLKWLLHKVSGKCELLRITYEEQPGTAQTKRIERRRRIDVQCALASPLPLGVVPNVHASQAPTTSSLFKQKWAVLLVHSVPCLEAKAAGEKSLQKSRCSVLKSLSRAERVDIDQSVREIVQLKQIVTDVHPKFEESLHRCLSYLCGYNRLAAQVEGHRQVKYSSENSEHEVKLMKLWRLYKPDSPLETRVSSRWGELGFQGTDPATDFRGMGLLGLDQLMYFADKYSKEAHSALTKSCHPSHGFSFAIVGINITDLQYQLMMKRKLRTHFYNLPTSNPSMDHYHEVYCYLMLEFTKLWFSEKPRDVMEFSRIRDKFQRHIVKLLKQPDTVLKAEFQQ